MKKVIIFSWMMLLASVSIAALNIGDKKIQQELKKQFPGQMIIQDELILPARYSFNGKFYKILTENNSQIISYIYIGRVSAKEAMEFFDYFILWDLSRTIKKVQILNYQSSHGAMIASPGWLKKFAGYSAFKPLEIGVQIDAISGATISVNKLTFDIKQKTFVLSELSGN